MTNNIYETFIAKSRYARYLDGAGRRENWGETVNRYFDFMEKHLAAKSNYALTTELRRELQDAVTNFEVMPSMRALMTAGRALERDNTAGYNCSYLPIDDPKAFDEAMFILLCGTGVGFSVERQYIAKLPEVPEKVYDSESVISVSDSKEGWAKALRQVIAMLYSGEAPQWDVSKVRAGGVRLKTFGGRASGPGPLVDLFKFVVRTFKNAQGRKLNSLECHDIMCKIGEVVVVGGVRRSAMISLSNLSDDRMRHAKSGAWWETQGQRALANNSACYTEKPDVGIFMQEWLALYESKSGERGIFNREAAKNVAKKNGRRDTNYDFGTNPCCFVGHTQIAVADGRNSVSIAQLAKESQGKNVFQVYSARASNTIGDTGKFSTWKTEIKSAIAKCTGTKPVFLVTLSNGDTFEATDDHPLATQDGTYVQVKDSPGVPLKGFFSVKDKYRRINSLSDAQAYQHRLIWEHHNGPIPTGFEIDHQLNNNNDSLCNLQVLPCVDHLAKTAEEHKGVAPTLAERIVVEPSPHEHLTASVYVVSIESRGEKQIFDLQVEDNQNFFIITRSFDGHAETSRGILVHNSEIILRPYQFCNLTEIIVRASDTMEDLKRKARIATILGSFQSTLTHFPYLRKIWRDNTEAERLLGVSMTGILDNTLLNNPEDADLPARLEELKASCVLWNDKFANALGIQSSVAITAVKPSGTVSQLTDTASGIHARHAAYYYRRVRSDIKDPLTQVMIDAGVPNEPDVMKPGSTVIFTFPKKAPEGSVLRYDLAAIKHLKLWLVYQRHYCEHKPSVTISVAEHEWPSVGAFVWDHFDEMSGVSFLPFDGGSYKQAPYEDCTREQYEAMLAIMPESIDWDALIENTDNVEGVQTLACTAGGCEI